MKKRTNKILIPVLLIAFAAYVLSIFYTNSNYCQQEEHNQQIIISGDTLQMDISMDEAFEIMKSWGATVNMDTTDTATYKEE